MKRPAPEPYKAGFCYNSGGENMKKPFLLACLTGSLLIAGYYAYPFALRAVFTLKGTVRLTPDLAERAARPNIMLFLVAMNESGVPVAVKKIIDPVFPLDFQMSAPDIIMPDILTRKVFLEAHINAHGELGRPRKGDLTGSLKGPVFIFSKRHDLVIDASAE